MQLRQQWQQKQTKCVLIFCKCMYTLTFSGQLGLSLGSTLLSDISADMVPHESIEEDEEMKNTEEWIGWLTAWTLIGFQYIRENVNPSVLLKMSLCSSVQNGTCVFSEGPKSRARAAFIWNVEIQLRDVEGESYQTLDKWMRRRSRLLTFSHRPSKYRCSPASHQLQGRVSSLKKYDLLMPPSPTRKVYFSVSKPLLKMHANYQIKPAPVHVAAAAVPHSRRTAWLCRSYMCISLSPWDALSFKCCE